MRAVMTGAMASALADLGFRPAFDAVYGMSSGAMNAAYFVAGEATWRSVSIYFEDLATRRFINFTRPFRRRSIVDMDYAFDDVVERRKPLPYEKVLLSETPLHVPVTWARTGSVETITSFEDADDLRGALRATSWLPGAVRGTAVFRGEPAIDGAVLVAHPCALAAADGCTHILSLSTHPLHTARRYNRVALRYATRYLDRLGPGLGDGYLRSLEVHEDERAYLLRSRTDPRPAPYVLDVGPLADAPPITRHETDSGTVLAAARYGYHLVIDTIGTAHPAAGAGPERVPAERRS